MKTDSEDNICPFCPDNGRVDIIDQTETAYLVQVLKNFDGEWIKQIGRYFVILKVHVESILDLPDDFMADIKHLTRKAIEVAQQDPELMELMEGNDLEDALEANWNNGKEAGSLVNHTHLWLLFRYDKLRLGPDGLIERCQSLTEANAEQRGIIERPHDRDAFLS